MAALEKIRNKAGLLVSIVIGLALLAFILGDLLSSGQSIFSGSRNNVADIAGKSVPVMLYQSKIDETIENYKRNSGQNSVDENTVNQIQDETWNQLLQEYLMTDQYDEIGVTVSAEELFDMVQGNFIDPQVMQIPIFTNQQTGAFDRNLVLQFLKNKELDPSGNAQSSWTAFEKALTQQKINNKYNTLIKKGMYVTSVQANKETADKLAKADFDYVVLPYSNLSDSAVNYTESDLKKYYNDNKTKFERPESREINYVTFQVVASQKDQDETVEQVNALKAEFETVVNIEQFVNLNSDIPFTKRYYAPSDITPNYAGLVDAEVGAVAGPFVENGKVVMGKVVKFVNLPDSVKASHILIRPSQDVAYEAAKQLADSLLNEVKKGAKFEDLAKQYSQDGSAEQGGDLGWFTEGAMVGPFNDACFEGKKGDLVTVETQFGIHVIKIVDQAKTSRKVQIAEIVHQIEPSTQTYQEIYATASQFGATNRTYESFRDAANTQGITLKSASFGPNERRIANLENPRQIVRWAYQANVGDVSEIFEIGDVFVIATVKAAYEKGIAPLADVKTDVEREVIKEKKAEYLAKELNNAKQGANTLQSIAVNAKTNVVEAKGVAFGSFSVPGLGFEPQVQAYAAMLEIDKFSEPISGNNGVFMIQVKSKIPAPEGADNTFDKVNSVRSLQNRVNYEVFNAIKEAVEIKDNRAMFY